MAFGELHDAVAADEDGTKADARPLLENGRPTAKGRGFVFDDDLVAAVDVALALGRPLLVAGEPGCGKTELGYAVARHLGIGRVNFAVVKSNSEAGDLFYTYDALDRFRAAQLQQLGAAVGVGGADVGDFIEFQGLGRAILDAHERAAVTHLLRGKHAQDRVPDPGPCRSVVVIDEIDKAPRDFPNDLLHEIEAMSFRVREFPDRPETPPADLMAPGLRPLVVITSNEERQLPDAFLRRCIFHEIAFPEPDRLARILRNGLGHRLARMRAATGAGLDEGRAAQLVRLLVDFRNAGPDKKPGIAELLDAAALLAVAPPAAPLTTAKPALAKLRFDRQRFDEIAG